MFVDANYFLRYFLGDNISQQKKVVELFEKSKQKKAELYTNIIVIFEIAWVMSTFYRKTKEEVLLALKTIVNFRFININEGEILEQAVVIFETHSLSLEDCFHIAYANDQRIGEMATFDKKLQKTFKELKMK